MSNPLAWLDRDDPPTPAGGPGACPDCGKPQWRDGVGRERCAACDAGRLRAALTEAGFGGWLVGIEAEPAPADGDQAEAPDWTAPSGWVELAGGVLVQTVRPEAASLDWNGLDEPGEPCAACGCLSFWQDYNGAWHCGRCTPGPLDRARRLAERAAELRRRNPPRPRAKIPRGGA